MRTRRDEVIWLLLDESAGKIEEGKLDEARSLLERALTRALEPDPLPGPWVEQAAFRLALVLLRCDPDPACLQRVVELLDLAVRSEVLGPWPAVYRLAALHRLGVENEVLAKDAKQALEIIRERALEGADHNGPLWTTSAAAQAWAMVEFLGLCVDLDLEDGPRPVRPPLPGRFGRRTWSLVGNTIGLHPQALPRALAIAEFEAYQLREDASEDLYFALPAQGTAWMAPSAGEPEPSHPQGLRLLASLLTEPPMSPEKLRERVLGLDASAAAWDKARSRLNKGLRAMMGTGKSAAIVQDELGRWVLSPELTILGLVEDAALDPSVRRRGSRFESDAPIGFRPRE